MDLLLILTYAAIAYGVFKLFKIPGEHLKAGDVLFRIEDTTYRNAVAQKRAALADSEQVVLQLKAALESAQKRAGVAMAERNAAKDAFQRGEKLAKGGVIAQSEFERLRGKYQASEASLSSAQAEADRAALEASATIEGVNTDVASLQADLATAEFNLSETIVRAPTDGTVLQLFLRKGMMAVPLPLRPVMIFRHDERPELVASFLQNSAQRVEEGSEAEVILPAVPGRFFKAKVESVGAVIPEASSSPPAH